MLVVSLTPNFAILWGADLRLRFTAGPGQVDSGHHVTSISTLYFLDPVFLDLFLLLCWPLCHLVLLSCHFPLCSVVGDKMPTDSMDIERRPSTTKTQIDKLWKGFRSSVSTRPAEDIDGDAVVDLDHRDPNALKFVRPCAPAPCALFLCLLTSVQGHCCLRGRSSPSQSAASLA